MNQETVSEWIARSDSRAEIRRQGGRLAMPRSYRWDPYNALALRYLFCSILTELAEDEKPDPSQVQFPRIVSRSMFEQGQIKGLVYSSAPGRASSDHLSDFERVVAGIVRLCGHDFGHVVLNVESNLFVACLLHPQYEAPTWGEPAVLDNYQGLDWNIVAGPCPTELCGHSLT